MILWGPPGVGKTTLSNLIAKELERPFYTLSAINSGVKDVREVIEKASTLDLFNKKKPILFIDEIHRFSKTQQDSLLGAVEKGIITLIGATTDNPSFEVTSALLSRSQVYVLKSLSKDDLQALLKRAIANDCILNKLKITLKETQSLIQLSSGDARKLLNLFELVISSTNKQEIIITNDLVMKQAQQNIVRYDKNGEQHYDIISAFIKSIRGSDPNGAIYWLARMIECGEDAKFIARRLLILASEDIGNANPTALIMANNCFQAINVIGYPESRIILSQTVIYLACSSKSNSAYKAINEAHAEVKKSYSLSVPLHLRNTPAKLMNEKEYKEQSYNQGQEFLPNEISKRMFYEPSNNSKENTFRETLKNIWKGKYNY
jgi:putative ATPase